MHRRTWSSSLVAGVVALGVVACVASTARAQQDSDERRIQKFVDDVGKTLYFLAWPSAKYEAVRFNGLARVASGADAKLTLSGKSALDGSDLWTELVLEIRNGRIANLRWGRNNAVVFKPGETISALGDVLAELNKQYARGNAGGAPPGQSPATAPLSLAAICLNNPTKSHLSYQLSWSGKSDNATLEPGQARLYWTSEASPSFTLSFDDSFVPGFTERRIRLVGASHTAEPSTCDEVTAYDFMVEAPAIGVAPRSWLPGIEHPYRAHLVRTETRGQWGCAPGYKWSAPEDIDNIDCIESSVGLVGMSLEKEDGTAYPKIAAIAPGGSAERAGLAAGLFVLAINGVSTENKTVDAVIPKIRGTAGTTVRISVTSGSSDDPPRTVTLTRR